MEGPANLYNLDMARWQIDALPSNLFDVLWEVYAKMHNVQRPVLSVTQRGCLRVLAAMVERQEREGWRSERTVYAQHERGR